MSTNEYLQKVLKSQKLENDELEALEKNRGEVEKVLRDKFGSGPTIRYGGSKAKGTMIRDSYDLDIICYFESDDTSAGDTLKDIYDSVKKCLDSTYYVEPKKSALRIETKEEKVYFHIDVVPGRYTDEKKEDVFLYQSNGDKDRLQTNLQKHINYVKDSGLTDVIKLIKYWKIRNGLQIKTFILELLVIEILKDTEESEGLDICLKKFWEQLKDKVDEIEIEDPANPTGNDLSELFDDSIKDSLSSLAKRALETTEQQGWEAVFGEMKSMDDEEKIKSINVIKEKNPSSTKPWCNIV